MEKKRNTVMGHDLGKYSNTNLIKRREQEIETRPLTFVICSTTWRILIMAVESI